MKRGLRFVHGDIELIEKLGRNDPCPCGSGKRFQALLHALGPVSTGPSGMIIGVNNQGNGGRIAGPRERQTTLSIHALSLDLVEMS